MIAYCMRMSFGVPQKLVIMSLNNKSFSYPADRVSFGKFRDSQSRMKDFNVEGFTRIEISKIECEMLQSIAISKGIPIVNVKLISMLYKHLGYDSKHHRYWTASDGSICQGCLLPYKVDLLLPDIVWKAVAKDKTLLCGRCIVDKLERRGNAAYNLVDTNEN